MIADAVPPSVAGSSRHLPEETALQNLGGCQQARVFAEVVIPELRKSSAQESFRLPFSAEVVARIRKVIAENYPELGAFPRSEVKANTGPRISTHPVRRGCIIDEQLIDPAAALFPLN
jgi:hypothetical protein